MYARTEQMVDTIKVVIFGLEDTIVITQSDLVRPRLDGNKSSLEDLILEQLIYLDAEKHRLLPDNDTIDKHLKSVQQSNNLTLDDLKMIFRTAGYSFEEGKRQFGIMTAVNSMVDFKIRSRLIVPERAVKAYYDEHPQIEEAAYYLQRAFVPFIPGKRPEILKKELELFIETGKTMLPVEWSSPFWITKSEVAEDKQFITTMNSNETVINQVIIPMNSNEAMINQEETGFELLKLVDKRDERVVPIEDRYLEIVDILRRPKYKELFEKYKAELFESASIIYFD